MLSERFFAEKPYVEVHAGRRVRKVSPNVSHAFVQLAVAKILHRCAGVRGKVGTELHFDMSVQLGEPTILVADVAFVRKERLFGISAAYLQVPSFAPDVAVEVRSPSDRPGERAWKLATYLRAGSALALDVAPSERTIRAVATGASDLIFGCGERFEHPAVPWLVFDVDEAFADLNDL